MTTVTKFDVSSWSQNAARQARNAMGHDLARWPGSDRRSGNASLSTAVKGGALMRRELLQGIKRGEFLLEYQPIYRLESGELHHVEALLRWESAALGRVSPELFIPLLEDMGQIDTVGAWVLRRACAQAAKWHETSTREVRVAVNVSPTQLLVPGFDEDVRRILLDADCLPQWIELEITESALMTHMSHIAGCLKRLADQGICIGLDDFGTGHSSLGRLSGMPIRHLKLDKGLIDNLPHNDKAASIVRSVVNMAHALGMELTVEGIERLEQQRFFSGDVKVHGQGYLLGRPMPAAQVSDLLPV